MTRYSFLLIFLFCSACVPNPEKKRFIALSLECDDTHRKCKGVSEKATCHPEYITLHPDGSIVRRRNDEALNGRYELVNGQLNGFYNEVSSHFSYTYANDDNSLIGQDGLVAYRCKSTNLN